MSLAEYQLDPILPRTAKPSTIKPMAKVAPPMTREGKVVADATVSSAASQRKESLASSSCDSGSELGRDPIPATALAAKPAFAFAIAAPDLASLNRLTRLKANQGPELYLEYCRAGSTAQPQLSTVA